MTICMNTIAKTAFLECGQSGGKCDWCGTNGFCCHQGKEDINGDCTTDMQNAILGSQFADKVLYK